MSEEHKCGPDGEPEFFEALSAVFAQHPNVSKNYSVTCQDHYTNNMGIDLGKMIKILSIENDQVVARFVETETADGNLICCEWISDPTGHRWVCAARWDRV
jgi:hypothetical protein